MQFVRRCTVLGLAWYIRPIRFENSIRTQKKNDSQVPSFFSDVEQRVPPVFGRAAITLDIGHISSYLCNDSSRTLLRCALQFLIAEIMVERLLMTR